MDKEKLMALVGVGLDETERLSQELGRPIDVDQKNLDMLVVILMRLFRAYQGQGFMVAHPTPPVNPRFIGGGVMNIIYYADSIS